MKLLISFTLPAFALITFLCCEAFVIPLGKVISFRLNSSPIQNRSQHSLTMTRTPIITGNWKMNPGDLNTALELARNVMEQTQGLKGVEVGVIPPFPFIVPVCQVLEKSHVSVGAQHVFVEDKGAFTGAVSGTMLSSVGCEYVLCGHSERRVIFQENNTLINLKVLKVLSKGMRPILCIGESKEEYESGLNRQVCAVQLGKNLADVTAEQMSNVVIAYEPVWAIGTGLTATPEIAQGVHSYIRSWLAGKYGNDVANSVRIQYGGSVTPESVDDLMACPDIDGALVGGASLIADKFARICRFESV